jgi:excisionase family DNA binding protein
MAAERIAYPLVEAAQLVGVSRTRIFDAVRKRELTVRKAGRVSLVMRDDLQAWIRSLPVKGAKSDAHV